MSPRSEKSSTQGKRAASDTSYLDGIRRAEGCSQDLPNGEPRRGGSLISETTVLARNWVIRRLILLAAGIIALVIAVLRVAQRLVDTKRED